MFRWLFKEDEESKQFDVKLDEKIKQADERIRQKQERISELSSSIEASKKVVSKLEEDVKAFQQTLNRNSN
jgi:predicted  nucleic acid-binding Zn-ribbon protein